MPETNTNPDWVADPQITHIEHGPNRRIRCTLHAPNVETDAKDWQAFIHRHAGCQPIAMMGPRVPVQGDLDEAFDATFDVIRDAGGDGWDDIDDPEAFLGRKGEAAEDAEHAKVAERREVLRWKAIAVNLAMNVKELLGPLSLATRPPAEKFARVVLAEWRAMLDDEPKPTPPTPSDWPPDSLCDAITEVVLVTVTTATAWLVPSEERSPTERAAIRVSSRPGIREVLAGEVVRAMGRMTLKEQFDADPR